jgi:hypothetical protein
MHEGDRPAKDADHLLFAHAVALNARGAPAHGGNPRRGLVEVAHLSRRVAHDHALAPGVD